MNAIFTYNFVNKTIGHYFFCKFILLGVERNCVFVTSRRQYTSDALSASQQ